MLPALAALSALKPGLKISLALLFLALVGFGVWFAVFKPRAELAEVRTEYANYRSTMIAATEKAAAASRAAQVAINKSLKEYTRESQFADERAKIALDNAQRDADRRLADLRRSGDDRVRSVWFQCLARPAPGDGADLAQDASHLSDDGAAALAPILAIGRAADVQYARAIDELTLTRGLLATCYAGGQ